MIWPLKNDNAKISPVTDGCIETARLFLRPAIMDDYAQWAAVRGKNKDYLKTFEPTWPAQCLGEEFFRRRVQRLNRDWLSDAAYTFVIFEKGKLIGGINLNNVARGAAQYVSLGYWLDQDAQGNGYMTEAAGAVIHYAFGPLALHRINAATLPHNTRSRRMLEQLGFVEEGFAKAFIQIDGVRADHILYGLNAPGI